MSVVTQLLCLCLFIYALIDCFWQNKHSHPSNYMLTQTANRAIDGSRCKHFSASTWPWRPAAIKAERQNGGRKAAAACWCRTACFWGSQKLLICFHTQPSLWFLKGMVQIRENQVLHKTPPTLRRMSYCDSRQRPHRLPLSAVHAQETEAAICTRPPKTRTKMLPVLKSLDLTFSISMVRLRIWCPQHESMEPSCLPSGGGGAIGMFSWQTLGHLIQIVL